MTIVLERARADDRAAVEALVAASGLPLEGLAEAFDRCAIARDASGAIVGAAAIEQYGDAGLLRSVAVAEGTRGTGVGRAVVAAAEDLARDDGITELYLLTETAIDWFPRLGYTVVTREEASAAVGASIEFTTVCRDTGVPMRKRLG